jgi:predicted nucleotidyltransferase
MSGGYFEYNQYKLEVMAEEIESFIENNNKSHTNIYGEIKEAHNLDSETIEKFKETAYNLRRTRDMVQRIDWLLSSDDSEDSFKKGWEKEIPSPWIQIKENKLSERDYSTI